MLMSRGYTSVSIPDRLLEEIDEIVKKGHLGYRSRSEFIKEALRIQIIRVRVAEPEKDDPR